MQAVVECAALSGFMGDAGGYIDITWYSYFKEIDEVEF